MQLACVLYDNFTMLDIVGPYQVLSAMPGVETVWVAETPGPVTDHTRAGQLVATHGFEQVPRPDLVVVPGGIGTEKLLPDHPVVDWLRQVHETTTWTTSVCTGSLLLAGAGLLTGKAATCHWVAMDQLAALGAEPTLERVVVHAEDRIVTAAGVSSGIDMGLTLADHMLGPELAQTIQLALEYDPQPPHDAGSPAKAPVEIVDLVKATLGVTI